MKNKSLWIFLGGLIVGVFLSANVPQVSQQAMSLQAMATGSAGGGFDMGGGYEGDW